MGQTISVKNWPGTTVVLRLRGVVLAIWGKYIEHLGILKRGCLVFHAPWYEKRVTSSCFELTTRMPEHQTSADDIDHLLVRVIVTGPHPTFLHTMSNQHHARVVRHYLPAQSVLWIGHVAVIRADNVDLVFDHEIPLKS